jgi:hypothetical protein
MTLFSEFFKLGKTQAELDFVDVPVDGDILLFIDPFAISQRSDRWSRDCHHILISFFQRVVNAIRDGHPEIARELLLYLREPNETRFGFSAAHPRGAGIGRYQSKQLFDALRDSSAVKTGFISSLEECELLIEGVSRDKISDLTTNIIRKHLAEYTWQQCALLGVPTQQAALAPYYSVDQEQWISGYFDLPVAAGRPVLLVPKIIARFDPAYDHQVYYRRFVLKYLQAEHLSANSSLVRTLKNRRRVVYKKDVKATFPCTKENLYRFSRENPQVLQGYRGWLEQLEASGLASVVDPEDESTIAAILAIALGSIPAGNAHASQYHYLMIGIVEFLFFPNLFNPRKEREIHQGRKRIDIVMENGARRGIFWRLHQVRKLPCAYVAIECKNYSNDVANPELDQLAGRFSPNRGKVGILCCRHFQDRTTFVQRCRDTLRDDRGLVIPLNDQTVIDWLRLIESGRRQNLDAAITRLIDEVWLD